MKTVKKKWKENRMHQENQIMEMAGRKERGGGQRKRRASHSSTRKGEVAVKSAKNGKKKDPVSGNEGEPGTSLGRSPGMAAPIRFISHLDLSDDEDNGSIKGEERSSDTATQQ